ncbi:MAG: FAD-binding protein [Afipia sp.]|nr:FAD-binding protein [Afipia sp.]
MTADVVVVGGGGAGSYAALHLKQLGFEPLLITKGLLGKSGCSIFAGNLVLSGKMLDSTDEQQKDTLEYFAKYWNNFLIDQNYLVKAGKWIENTFYPELDEAGLYFRRNDQGDIVASVGRVRNIAANKQGQSGMLVMDRRRKQIEQLDIQKLEETTVTALITNTAGSVTGVIALHYPDGEMYAISCRAVVLATGHSDRLAKRSTGTREQSADGIALAYRVGAELANLEIQWWHTSDFAYPKTWDRMHVYPNPLVGSTETARQYNSDGELFFEQKTDAPVALAPYATQFKRLGEQVMKGKARFDGGYTTSYSHISPDVIKEFNYHAKAFDKMDLDVGSDQVESAVSWHCRQGGINVDPHTMETSVPGLYVAGGVGSHSNGGLGVVTYDGYVVAETIAQKMKPGAPAPTIPQNQIEAEEQRLRGLLRPTPPGGCTPMHIKNRIRELMWDKMGFIKTTEGMNSALDEIRHMRTHLIPNMGLKSTTERFNYGWIDAIDALNMLDVTELTIVSSLERKESRGPFFRPEFPVTDNTNWHGKNILYRDENGKICFRMEKFDTPFLEPGFDKRDYFQVDW